MRIILSIIGVSIFLIIAKLGYCLLIEGKLSGAEFVSLVIAFAIIGLILSFASEVQEFSVAGNIVKLKEVKRDAEKSINELKSARTETFRFLLSLAKRHPGGLSDGGTIDSRVSDFWSLYNKIVTFKCEDELSSDLLEVIDIILKGQLYSISNSSDNLYQLYYNKDKTPEPSQLTIDALDDSSVLSAANRGVASGDQEKIKKMIIEGLEEYRKLYELRNKYKSEI